MVDRITSSPPSSPRLPQGQGGASTPQAVASRQGTPPSAPAQSQPQPSADTFNETRGGAQGQTSRLPPQPHVPVHQPGRALYTSQSGGVGASTSGGAIQSQYQKKQEYKNSCGAAGLLCAAMELGRTELPKVDGERRWDGRQLDNKTPDCERAIYSVSSGSKDGALENAGYSLPHNLTEAAARLGLNSHVQVKRGLSETLLRTDYPDIIPSLKKQNVQIKLVTAEPTLKKGQRRLRVMTGVDNPGGFSPVPNGNLHYLMERPDGSIMDPATGVDHKNLESLNGKYFNTGISVVVHQPQ